MKRLLLSSAMLAVSLAAFAGPGDVKTTFVENRGVNEFSGRMIARPRQMNDMLGKGMPYHEALTTQATARHLAQPLTIEYVNATDEYIIRVPVGKNENKLASELLSTGAFQYVEPDWTVYPVSTTPNDPNYSLQWHHPKIQSNLAWDLFRGNNTVTVAITDTGVRLDHQDLQARLVPGYNSVTNLPQSSGGLVDDINGHGTHCAGIAAASGNNGLGVSGIGWNFNIMPVRVTNSSGGSSSITALTNGARWAADNGARVVSTSYSGVSSAAVQTTGNYIKTQRNGIYIWAAGNSNTNLSTFDHADVTIVGATDSNDLKASFSSYGLAVDVFAPGVNIHATLRTTASSYGNMSGTSMATPCTAGVAAMIMATNPSLTGADVETILYGSCNDLGPVGNDTQWGWGRVNVNLGVRKSYNEYPIAPTSVALAQGTPLGGGPVELWKSDDQYASYLIASARQLIFNFESRTTILALGSLNFKLESSCTVNGNSRSIELFDFNTNTWVNVDNGTTGSGDEVQDIATVNPGRFVQAGTGLMKARVIYTNTRAAGFQVNLDQVGWFTRP